MADETSSSKPAHREELRLDAIDREILSTLSRSGRLSFRELGERVALSANAVAARVRRLEDAGAIAGYHAVVEPRALGRTLSALIDVRLAPGTAPERFEAVASRLDTVEEVAFLTGRFDFQLRIACRDADDLNHTLRRLRRDAGVADTETRVILHDLILGGLRRAARR